MKPLPTTGLLFLFILPDHPWPGYQNSTIFLSYLGDLTPTIYLLLNNSRVCLHWFFWLLEYTRWQSLRIWCFILFFNSINGVTIWNSIEGRQILQHYLFWILIYKHSNILHEMFCLSIWLLLRCNYLRWAWI